VLSVSCALLLATPAGAADPVPEEDLTSLEVHGFVSQGLILTVENEWLAQDSTRGSFEFSEVGLNFTKKLTDTLQLGVQLFAQDFGPTGNYAPRFDWFYADYHWQDWLGLRVGRLKIPYGLHNEVFDVDSARVPVLLPGSVYPTQNRETLFAHTGVELYGFARSSALGALDYRAFLGTMFFDPDTLNPVGSGLDVDFHVPYVFGGRLLWETPLEGLRVGGSVQKLRLEPTFLSPLLPEPLLIVNETWLWVASAEYAIGELMLTAEYSRWHTEQRSNLPDISGPLDLVNERAYAMATYRLTPWFHPGAYYSLLYPDTDLRDGPINFQRDLALTLRFDINNHWIAKLEGHYMSGTAGLLNPLMINPPDITAADPHWGAFFVKMTAYF
jgi:hypothetical protein